MSISPEQSVIKQFSAAATTPFGTLKPAKIVARTMPLLKELRTKHRLGWEAIVGLFNAAMAEVKGKPLTAGSLSRFYNLQRQRDVLQTLDRRMPPASVTSDETVLRTSNPGLAEDHRWLPAEQELQAEPQIADTYEPLEFSEPAPQLNRARDGPGAGEQSAGTGEVFLSRAAESLARLQEKKNYEELKKKGTKNGR